MWSICTTSIIYDAINVSIIYCVLSVTAIYRLHFADCKLYIMIYTSVCIPHDCNAQVKI